MKHTIRVAPFLCICLSLIPTTTHTAAESSLTHDLQALFLENSPADTLDTQLLETILAFNHNQISWEKAGQQVQSLLDQKANVHVTDTDGNTPLHLAVLPCLQFEHFSGQIVTALVLAGASTRIANNNFEVPLEQVLSRRLSSTNPLQYRKAVEGVIKNAMKQKAILEESFGD